ncbi:hypothetical protein M422DRAFT_247383 [Sphaerobolus stellatus SS14]|uniref:Uncharacterized protein n=1 Tax=Sphaerobolus stellatus (strain SS14) TaxID=990650 RepID=A0A0C9UDL3_SPHS4|nr:hypothetical protein M422DRAFT_275889 [Sphaerobolus stellatus SS14]KIJ48535.1 hypothetical protein M422DRAFT_247383 [Sphaerobolus stellatus SS14]
MSFIQIWGNFELKDSYRLNPFDNQPDDIGFHLHYKSQISTKSGSIPVDIRVFQPISEHALPDGCVAFVFGRFHMPEPNEMQIEAIHIFKYHHSLSSVILRAFQPRVVISGFIFQKTEVLDDGTKLIFINAMAHIRDYYQVLTVIGSMAVNNRWPAKPPTPKLYSSVHISGFLDCIDTFSLIPVVVIEEITLEVGNKRVADLINQARFENSLSKFHRPADSTSRMPFQSEVDFDFSWGYAESRVSLSSVPSYQTPYPTPFPLDGTPYWYPKTEDPVYPAPQFPALIQHNATKEEINTKSDEGLKIIAPNPTMASKGAVTKHAEHEAPPGSLTDSNAPHSPMVSHHDIPHIHVKAASDQTISDGEYPTPREANSSTDTEMIRLHTVYMEDLIPAGERDMPSRYKRSAPQTPPITPQRHARKRSKSLSSSQTTLQTWMGSPSKANGRSIYVDMYHSSQTSKAPKNNSDINFNARSHQLTPATIIADQRTTTAQDILLAISKRKHELHAFNERFLTQFSNVPLRNDTPRNIQRSPAPFQKEPPTSTLINDGSVNVASIAAPYPLAQDFVADKQNMDMHRNDLYNMLNATAMQVDGDNHVPMGANTSNENAGRYSPDKHRNASPQRMHTSEGVKGMKFDEKLLSNISDEDIDAEVWQIFLHFKTLIRALAVERCKKNSALNRRFFFYINCLAFHDFLHKQYLVEFNIPSPAQSS